MRAALLALALAACGAPPDAPEAPAEVVALAPEAAAELASDPAGPDLQAWLAEARALPVDSLEARTAHGERLAAFVDWPRACDSYVDPETGETVYEPMDGGFIRGDVEVTDVADDEALVAVVCFFGAYQGSYALVWIDGDAATLLEAPALGLDGRPLEATERMFATPDASGFAEGTLVTFARARGLGDCGTYVRYAHDGGAALRVEEVRQRDCGDEIPDDLPPPSAWPVAYSAG